MENELHKLLFVDDDSDIHLIVKYSLRDLQNVEIRWAFSGEEAIKIALEFEPDLILLDVMMPGMDGVATLDALRLLPKLAKTPIAFLTAKAQSNEVEEYYKHGIVDVILKPFDPTQLTSIVQQIWNKHQKEQSSD